jgi:alpha-beta hydrolase superfamily lysophospholipase
LGIPILIVQDPHDHLVHPDGVDPFIEAAEHTEVDTVWLPGAEHELTLGPRHTEVSHTVSEFLNRLCLAK